LTTMTSDNYGLVGNKKTKLVISQFSLSRYSGEISHNLVL